MRGNHSVIALVLLTTLVTIGYTGLSEAGIGKGRLDYVPGEILVKFKDKTPKSRVNLLHQGFGAVKIK